jgi:hypothetical protein
MKKNNIKVIETKMTLEIKLLAFPNLEIVFLRNFFMINLRKSIDIT